MNTPPNTCWRARSAPRSTPIDPATYRSRRCHYANGDPIAPADMAAALVIGQLRRVIIDTAGVVIDLGRRCRLFRGSSRIAAQLQYWRCLHPGCGVLTKHAQIDHNTTLAHPRTHRPRQRTHQMRPPQPLQTNRLHHLARHHRPLAHPTTRRHRNQSRLTARQRTLDEPEPPRCGARPLNGLDARCRDPA